MTIRTRLTLWFVVAMTALIVATSLTTYLIVRSRLEAQAARSAARARTRRGRRRARRGRARQARRAGRPHLADRGERPRAREQLPRRGRARLRRCARCSHIRRAGSTIAARRRATRAAARSCCSRTAICARRSRPSAGRSRWSTVAVLVATALAGSLLAARALRPVDRLRREVDEIPGDALELRVAEGRPDELGRLARAFNRLLARAARAAEEQQRFVADASHELKTPVTALQGHARIVARAAERGDLAQARDSALVVEAQTRRLAGTLGELLSLAESGAGALRARARAARPPGRRRLRRAARGPPRPRDRAGARAGDCHGRRRPARRARARARRQRAQVQPGRRGRGRAVADGAGAAAERPRPRRRG